MRYSGEVFGKEGKAIAQVMQFTQPVQSIGSDGTVLANTSIHTRLYEPANGSRLKKLGVEWVETTRTPYGSDVTASVRTFDGHRTIDSYSALRSYIHLMK